MRISFEEAVERIAHLQHKTDQYVQSLSILEARVIDHKGTMTGVKKVEIIELIETMKLEIGQVIQRRIDHLKNNMDS